MMAISIVVAAVFFIIFSLILEWVDRKVYAHVQHRVGPFVAGYHGIFQPIADFLKLMNKDEVVVEGSDEQLLHVMPILSLTFVLFSLLFVPVASVEGLLSFKGDLIIILAFSVLIHLFYIVTGLSQRSIFASIGAARWGQLLISFEIPLLISVTSAAFVANSITLSEIVSFQSNSFPIILLSPLSFFAAIFASLAKIEKTPFSVPDAETEIAGGWLSEVSGRRLAIFRIVTDLKYLLLSALIVTLFLGGPIGPTIKGMEPFLFVFWFLVKLVFVAILLSYVRGIVARYRIDQVIRFFWFKITPLAAFNLIVLIFLRMGKVI
ncbi:MAG: complex I subunit 1 family protein [Nitrososphaeria archaeon]